MNEVVPVKMRAGLVDIHAVCLVFGYFVQGWVGFGFYFWTDGNHLTVTFRFILTFRRWSKYLAASVSSAMRLAASPALWLVLDS